MKSTEINNTETNTTVLKRSGIFRITIIFILVLLLISMSRYHVNATESKYMTRIEFICRVVDEMAGKKDFDGRKLKITIKNDGKTKIGNTVISSAKVKKYEKKYGITLNEASHYAIALNLGLISSKTFKKLKANISTAAAAVILAKADELLYGDITYRISKDYSDIILETEDLKLTEYVLKYRIQDGAKIRKTSDRVWFAKAYVSGFVRGSYKEKYDSSRYFSPSAKAKRKELKKMIEMLTRSDKRNRLSADFQILKDKNLPRNASLYGYVIDSYPNSYYETGFSCLGNMLNGASFLEASSQTLSERMKKPNFIFVFPREIQEFNSLIYPGEAFKFEGRQFMEENRNNKLVKELTEASVEFYQYAFNVNYKTIASDTKWKETMSKYLGEKGVEEYITACQKNKTIIECDRVAADASSVYWYDGQYNCKVYAHIRILSDIPLENGDVKGDSDIRNGYLYPVKKTYEPGDVYTRIIFGNMYLNYKQGEWVDMYQNTTASADQYHSLCCSQTARDIMIDYTGIYPWLIKFPF